MMLQRVILIVMCLGPAALAQAEVVSGRVVDSEGRGVAGVEVARSWFFTGGEAKARQGVRTAADGAFELDIELHSEPEPILAIDSAGDRGGTLVIDPQTLDDAVHEIRLEPLAEVRATFVSTDLGRAPQYITARISMASRRQPIASSSPGKEGAVRFKLPPGEYELLVLSADAQLTKLAITVDVPITDLGTVDLEASIIQQHLGKLPPPIHVTQARGAPDDVSLADYKGKWVLVSFWAYWCGPCIDELGDLIDLAEAHPELRDKFEVLAIHHVSAPTLEELDKRLPHVVETAWGGRDLPFPILLDSTGQTERNYGIAYYPTVILIDPDGTLVDEGTHQMLVDVLEAMAEPQPGTADGRAPGS